MFHRKEYICKKYGKIFLGYENLYKVSTFGRIKSYKNGILNLVLHHSGYLTVNLSKNNKVKKHFVHSLVAIAFLDKTNFKYMPNEDVSKINLNKLQINHKNEIKTCNKVGNLEYCTSKYNCNFGTRTQRLSNKINRKINQYDLNGNFIKEWDSLFKASKSLGICKSGICQCCNGKYKTSNGFIWRYAD